MATTGTYIKSGEFVTRAIAGETIVVPIKAGVGDLDSIYTLNEVGATIWGLIDGTTTVDGIVAACPSSSRWARTRRGPTSSSSSARSREAGMIRPLAGKPG